MKDKIIIISFVLAMITAIVGFIIMPEITIEHETKINEEQTYVSTDLDVDWEQVTTGNYTYRIAFWCSGNNTSIDDCKEEHENRKELIRTYGQTESDCGDYEKIGSQKWGQGTQEYPYFFVDRCVPLSDNEIMLKKIAALEERVAELEQSNITSDEQMERREN